MASAMEYSFLLLRNCYQVKDDETMISNMIQWGKYPGQRPEKSGQDYPGQFHPGVTEAICQLMCMKSFHKYSPVPKSVFTHFNFATSSIMCYRAASSSTKSRAHGSAG
jgi:hypothetical protein